AGGRASGRCGRRGRPGQCRRRGGDGSAGHRRGARGGQGRAARGAARRRRADLLAAEEPLEMRVTVEEGGRRVRHGVAVTMRTPGHDFALTAGFFLSEGIVASREAIWSIAYCQEADEPNVVEVHLRPDVPFDPLRFSRNVYTTSSCGVCGKTSIDLVRAVCPARPLGRERIASAVLTGLPETLRRAQ